MDVVSHLTKLFDAERTVRAIHRDLLAQKPEALMTAIVSAVRDAAKLEPSEAGMRFVRIAPLLQSLHGPEPVDMLIDLLGAELPEARLAAGEALEGMAFERFKEVALGVERALGRLPEGHPALTELPYLLAEVGETGVTRLIGRFLSLSSAEVVAAAIEALAELGDPSAEALLRPLCDDMRRVHLDEEEEDVTIGVLAAEACELLEDEGE